MNRGLAQARYTRISAIVYIETEERLTNRRGFKHLLRRIFQSKNSYNVKRLRYDSVPARPA